MRGLRDRSCFARRSRGYGALGRRKMNPAASPCPAVLHDPCSLSERLFATRRWSLELTHALTAEDMTVQVMDDASPTKWHLAHTSWFFEALILSEFLVNYTVFDDAFNYCF